MTRPTKSYADVRARLLAREEIALIDVREESEWAKGHLPGATYLGRGVIERDIETRYPDPVTIHMAMGAVGRSSTRTLARVSQGDTIICGVEGAQATMCEGRPHPMSEAQRENALRFLVHA